MDRALVALELLGALSCVLGCVCSLLTVALPQWLSLSTDLLPTESFRLGLWETCVVQDHGVTQCRPYHSLLGLPPDIRLARILMLAALCAGVSGLLFSIPGLALVNGCRWIGSIEAKRTLKLLGGTLSLASGVLGLIPVSYVAHLTVLRFFDESVPSVVPRWEFGDALFFGWTAGCLHLVAGLLLVVSCVFFQDKSGGSHQSVPLYRAGASRTERAQRRRTEYV